MVAGFANDEPYRIFWEVVVVDCKVISQTCTKRLKKTMKNIGQNTWSSRQMSTSGPPEQEAGMATIPPFYFVSASDYGNISN
jgi:hypothetical protein